VATTEDRYIPDENEVTAKVVDGEAIIINLLTGVYYSMDGAGALVWQGIEKGASVGEIVEALAAVYAGAGERLGTDVPALVDRLVEERMVKPVTAALSPFTADTPLEPAYATPELVAYRDMAEVLALDPPTPGVFDTLLRDPDPGSGNR